MGRPERQGGSGGDTRATARYVPPTNSYERTYVNKQTVPPFERGGEGGVQMIPWDPTRKLLQEIAKAAIHFLEKAIEFLD